MRLFLLLLLSLPVAAQAQGSLWGRVSDELSGDALPGAQLIIGNQTFKADNNGLFRAQTANGYRLVVVKHPGYRNDTFEVQVDGETRVDFTLEPQSRDLDAVKITASIAGKRKTPIAFSNMTGRKMSELLGSQDMPMALNYTPGVYATQQGGGAGDARITIRGFNQRNIAVMIDGIPVNDMENGQVYWSNWFGLADVTALTQVQRGLGSSRIANPSVGGTMNIITKGITSKPGARISTQIGDSRFRSTSFALNTGRLKGDWGLVLAGTMRQSNGYVDKLYDQMYSYFLKAEKNINAFHTVSFTVIGAPQSHGQRSFRARLPVYDAGYAAELGIDTVISNSARNMGRRYNQHWGWLDRYNINGPGDTVFAGKEALNERENMFHKPQAYVKHTYTPNKRLLITTTVYASYGRGGGTSARGVAQVPFANGNFNFQDAYHQNVYGSAFVSPIDPDYSETEKKSRSIISRAVNNHNWFGALSTFQYKLKANMNLSGGVDLRTYRGIHYREVHDLLGGDYYRPDGRELYPLAKSPLYRKGDIFGYYNEGYVRWGGAFAEWEYSHKKFSTFANLSFTRSNYQRRDYFKADADGNPAATPWIGYTGYTAKAGFNRNFSRKVNAFVNVGRLVRPQRFNNVFDNQNRLVQGVKNEEVQSVEGGVGFKSRYFSTDLNLYYTTWLNKPVDNLPSYIDPDGNQFSYNINGLKARHKGIELSAALKPVSWISWEVAATIADWIWNSGSVAEVRDDNGNTIARVDFSAVGVHVGDAAQQQFSSLLRIEPVKGAYLTPSLIWFGKQFADFDPTALVGTFKDSEAWRIPNYHTFNLAFGYNKRFKGMELGIFGNVFNITNRLYISDAQHRNQGSPAATLNPKNIEVYVAPGTRWTTGIRLGF